MPPALITPMLVGAAVGAVSAAVQGGNILKGALLGAVTAGIANFIAPAIGGALGSATSGAAEAASIGATEAAATTGATAGVDAATSAAWSSGAPGLGADTLANVGANAAPAAAEAAASAGATGTGIGAQAPSGMAVTPAGGTTSLGNVIPDSGIAQPTGSQGTGLLDTIFKQGKDFLSSRAGMDATGRVLTGAAQGMLQDKLNNQKIEAENRARANARYGSTGSRYNPTGGMLTAAYK